MLGGMILAYNAGQEGGRREVEGRSLTADDVESFEGSRTECQQLNEDRVVYRYISVGGDPHGKYRTPTDPEFIDDPQEVLALPPWNEAVEAYAEVLPRGTVVCQGGVAAQPRWGRRGGGQQYVVLPKFK